MTDDWDLFGTPTQGVMKTHGPSLCAGGFCCIHNPSEHHMAGWPLVFNMNKAAMGERICEHNYRHPDPDAYSYLSSRLPVYLAKIIGTHNCCGCCLTPKEE